jgi:mannose-6-phosphate isomerase-like protein (cupin superfamily)
MPDQPAGNAYNRGERDTRPWGSWEVLDLGPRHVVKRIVVLPGAQLSLQRHQGRHEHWVVVQGTAKVTLDDEVRTVEENGNVFIPVRTWHRLENPGSTDLSVIEIQYGTDLREDDIERRDDIYGRT